MSAKIDINPALLDAMIQILREALDRFEADACALARLDTPEARALAQERLESAKTAGELLGFFGSL